MPKFLTVERDGKQKQILAKFRSKYESEGWKPAGDITLTTDVGERTLPAEEALARLDAGKAEGVVSEETKIRRSGGKILKDEYGGKGWEAAGLGAVSSIPLVGGYAAKAIGGIGGDEGETAAIAGANQGAFLGGQVLGTVLQAAAPGALAGKAGKLAGYTPGGLLTKAATAAGKRGSSKAASLAAEGIADGAAWTIAQNHANSVINDTPLNAEMLVAGLPTNMLLGGAFGAGLGKLSSKLDANKIAAKAVKSADDIEGWKALDDKLSLEKLNAEKAAKDLKLDVKATGRQQTEAGKRIKEANAALKEHRAAQSSVDKARTSLDASPADRLNAFADDITSNRAGRLEFPDLHEAANSRATRQTVADAFAATDDDAIAFMDTVRQQTGKDVVDIEDYFNLLDDTSSKIFDLEQALPKTSILDLDPAQFNKALETITELEQVERSASRLLEPFGADFTAKRGASLDIPEMVGKDFLDINGKPTSFGKQAMEMGVDFHSASPEAGALAKAYVLKRGSKEIDVEALRKVIDSSSAKLGDEEALLKQLDAAQAEAGATKAVKELTQEGADDAQRLASEAAFDQKKFRIENAKPSTPRIEKPTGLVAQLADATLGRMSKTLKYGQQKISGGIGSFIKAAGKPRRGTVPAASVILGKLRFDEDLGEKPKKAKGRKKEMMRVTKELDELMASPDKFKERIGKTLRAQNMVKPGMSDSISSKALERAMFLHGLVPRSPNNTPLSIDTWQPSDTEIDKFTRIAAAAEDPYSILDDLETGRLTQEAVDTVKQLYPEIYHSIQMELVNRAEEIKQNVKYKGQLQLGILFQAPTNEFLEPSFGKIMQENYAIRAQEQEQAGGQDQYSTPGNNQKAIASTATTSQRLEVAK